MTETFKAFVIDKDESGKVTPTFKQLSTTDLPKGDVLIKVHYSGINYKDALASQDHNAGRKIVSYDSRNRFSWYNC